MDLSFDLSIANAYKSKSQKARVLTETWVARNIYCPNCGCSPVQKFENNRPVADFWCASCAEEFELKSKNGKFSSTIVDGAYQTMIAKIRSNNNPNFFFLNHTKEMTVSNFIVIPKHFFTPEIIIKRKPLSPNAKRAGWVGCTIDMSKISESGKIFLVNNGRVINPDLVQEKFQKTLFLRQQSADKRGWLLEMLKCLDKISDDEFTLKDIYTFEADFKQKYPDNHHIREKIRQQLQVLRDQGIIEFLGKGRYRKL
ncbi:DpnI domain-containing protein [Streptococcus tangpeifui]|uniref:DpnI domain-containing protein n=1 Tax=Streptococcus tangpeifui TaxID=2709400 RepID=UPI0013EB74AF|nr:MULTISPECIES: DpnI domain-containing protein [unclassified Streptococcus]